MDEAVLRWLTRVASRCRLCCLVVFGRAWKVVQGRIATIIVVAVKAGRDLSLVECGLLRAELEECVDASLDLLVVGSRDLIAVWEALAHGGSYTIVFFSVLPNTAKSWCEQ